MSSNDHLAHPGVYRPAMFICGADPDDSYVTFDVRNPADISAALLEAVTDWWQALRELPADTVPDGVRNAMEALHEATCGWSDWTARNERRATAQHGEGVAR